MSIHVEIERDASIRGYSIWITKERPDGKMLVAAPVDLVFGDVEQGAWDKPTLRLSGREADEFLSGFANALVGSGFKATGLLNVNKEIEAIKYHLEDMRRLALGGNSAGQPK